MTENNENYVKVLNGEGETVMAKTDLTSTVGTTETLKQEPTKLNRHERRFMKAMMRRTQRSKRVSVNKVAFYRYIV